MCFYVTCVNVVLKNLRDVCDFVSSWKGMHVNICQHVSKRMGIILLHGFETLKYYKLHTAPVIMRYSSVGSTGQFQIILFLTVGCEVILNHVYLFVLLQGTITTNITVFVVSNSHSRVAHINC